jgi:hypothetical protein
MAATQTGFANAGTGGTTSVGASISMAGGESVAVTVHGGFATAGSWSVSDGVNTYAGVSTLISEGAQAVMVFEAHNVTAGTRSVTASSSFGASLWGIGIATFSGIANVAAQDGVETGSLSGATFSTGNLTPTSEPAIIVGAATCQHSATTGPDTGFTSLGTYSNVTVASVGGIWKRITSTTPAPASFTSSSPFSGYVAAGMVLTEDAGAPPATTPGLLGHFDPELNYLAWF